MVVDPTQQLVFISEPLNDVVVAANYQGQIVAQIPANDVVGLTLSGDDSTLYAADRESIEEIDTNTLQVTGSLGLQQGDCSAWVTLASDRLWANVWNCSASYSTSIMSIDPTQPAGGFVPSGESNLLNQVLMTSPSPTSSELGVAGEGSPGFVGLYAISGTSLILQSSSSDFGGDADQIAFSSDDKYFYPGTNQAVAE
jgi:hypothetical protein